MKTTNWTPAKLAKLKTLNAKIAAALAELAKADGAEHIEADRRLKLLMAEFDSIAHGMPAVKMDTESGEYFPAHNSDGQEVFRVKVCRMTVQDVYDIPAADEAEAIRKALALQDVTPVRWAFAPAQAKVISASEKNA